MLAAIAVSLLLAPHALFTGPEFDYQPSIAEHQNALVVVFERLQPPAFSGDLFLTRSLDGGTSWSAPSAIVATPASERAPALVHLGDRLALFYIAQTQGAFRIHRATSFDGEVWSAHGPIDLGWPAGGEVNPDVIREANGSLTMTYHRLSGPSYIARSTDGGTTWDTLRTQVSDGTAALPRIAKRESDGTYLVTYQTNPGNSQLRMFSKTSTDPYNWSTAASPLSVDGNSHDSKPFVMLDGTFGVVYADARGESLFNLFRRSSRDGRTWSDAIQLTHGALLNDVQPHPLEFGKYRLLLWSRQNGPTEADRDLWIDVMDGPRRRAVR
jgi:hypothetical protein